MTEAQILAEAINNLAGAVFIGVVWLWIVGTIK